MTTTAFRIDDLTKSERFLLDWLSKEDVSALGECKGRDLDRLVMYGLAKVTKPSDGRHEDFSHVSLTPAGLAAWQQMVKSV